MFRYELDKNMNKMKISKSSNVFFTIFQPYKTLGNTRIDVMPEVIDGQQKVLISIYEEWNNNCIEEVALNKDVVGDLITVLSLVDFD